MTLITHYDLELYQMDVKATFLNGKLVENVYMAQPNGFDMKGKEKQGHHLNKCIYRLKQSSRRMYLELDKTTSNFGFKENIEDNYIIQSLRIGYLFVLYVDYMVLASSDKNMLFQTKRFLLETEPMPLTRDGE
jgi:hypothetical protein